MSGTITPPSDIMLTQLPNNTSGAILPQHARNVVETSAGTAYATTPTQTVSFAPAVTDRGTVTRCNHATVAINVTINTALWVAGYTYGFRSVNAATVTLVAGSSVTLLSSSGTLALRTNGSLVYVVADTVSNTFYVDGDLA